MAYRRHHVFDYNEGKWKMGSGASLFLFWEGKTRMDETIRERVKEIQQEKTDHHTLRLLVFFPSQKGQLDGTQTFLRLQIHSTGTF